MAKSTKPIAGDELTLASAQNMTEAALVSGIITNLDAGKKAYRRVFTLYAALVAKCKGDETAAAKKVVGCEYSDLQNARTLYRAFDRVCITHKILAEEEFGVTVTFSLAVAINSIFHNRGSAAAELIRSKIGTEHGRKELLHIAETGKTYAEAKDAEAEKKAAAKPSVKVSETSAVEETKASAAEAGVVVPMERDPVSEFDSIAAALEETAVRLVGAGKIDAKRVADRFDAIMQNISAALAAANQQAG